MTEPQVAKLVAVLIATYPSAKITADTSAVYERMLADLDFPAANAAIERLLATSKWLPTIAEIREAALTLYRGETRPGGDAWGEVLRAISRYGYARTPGIDFAFSDPVVAECVRALTWRELCDSENQEADRARFIELYDRIAAALRRSRLSESLPAMQSFRALQEQRKRELESGEPQPIGKLLPPVTVESEVRQAWCARCGDATACDADGCIACRGAS